MYETYDSPRRSQSSNDAQSNKILGAALGIAPNGLGVLRSLRSGMFEKIMQRGYPLSSFRFQSARGWHLGDIPCHGFSEPVLPIRLITRQDL